MCLRHSTEDPGFFHQRWCRPEHQPHANDVAEILFIFFFLLHAPSHEQGCSKSPISVSLSHTNITTSWWIFQTGCIRFNFRSITPLQIFHPFRLRLDQSSDFYSPSLLLWPLCINPRNALTIASSELTRLFLFSKIVAYTYMQYSHCVRAVSETTVLGASSLPVAALTGPGPGVSASVIVNTFVRHQTRRVTSWRWLPVHLHAKVRPTCGRSIFDDRVCRDRGKKLEKVA